jgi:hypothetical protein
MRISIRAAVLLAALAAALASLAGTATAAAAARPVGVVFALTDNTTSNQVVAYDRATDGSLTPAGTYDTGGTGGVLDGSVVDHTASQGALTLDNALGARLLLAVNAGSSTISAFRVAGDRLGPPQVLPSGGSFPVSIAARGNLVYVLNALDGGSLQGYAVLGGRLFPLPGSHRSLGLDPTATPQFTNTPGQVAFSPDGSKLIVTTKANGNAIDVFSVGFLGYLSQTPVVNPEPGTVPFAVEFDRFGNLVVAEAGTNALATFSLASNGTLTPLSTVGTGQKATCWIAEAGPYFYASNAGSASESGYLSGPGGSLELLGATPTDPGTVDAAATPDGSFLYVQAGGPGTVDAYRVNGDGSLAGVGSVTVPGAAGGEGIVAL